MDKFIATVRVKGQSVKIAIFADSSLHARLILEFQFGIGSVLVQPTKTFSAKEATLDEQGALKPLDPQQARLQSLKKQKELVSNNLDNERKRLKIAKAQQQIRMATS
jgi:hypothetical protein